MSDPVILFVKPKAINESDKSALREAGIIVVEVDDLQSVKFTRAGAELSSTALLRCAAEVIQKAGYPSIQAAFGVAVCSAIQHATQSQEPT